MSCSVASTFANTLCTQCVYAVPLHKTPCCGHHFEHAAACYLHSVLDSALCERCGNVVGSSSAPSVGALWARRVRSVRTLCKSCIFILDGAFAINVDNNSNYHEMYYYIFIQIHIKGIFI